jgi:hypothetical protein
MKSASGERYFGFMVDGRPVVVSIHFEWRLHYCKESHRGVEYTHLMIGPVFATWENGTDKDSGVGREGPFARHDR